MNNQSLIDIFRGVTNDDQSSTNYWPNGDVLGYLDGGEKRFAATAPDECLGEIQAVTITTLPAAATGQTLASVTLPADFFQFRMAEIRRVAAGSFYPAAVVPMEEFYAQVRTESPGQGKTGNPVVGVWNGALYAYPVSTGSITNGLRLYYLKILPGITSTTGTPTINEQHHSVLVEWALYQGWLKIGQVQRAQMHKAAFDEYIQALHARWHGQALQTPWQRVKAATE